jgi:tRNA modification GTPase
MRPTIAAIATAPGPGAVGIVRLSGPLAGPIGRRLFRPNNPRFAGFQPSRLHYGTILDATGQPLDQGLMALFPAPHSFTGEDVLEIHAHGGPLLLRRILAACLDCGAQAAAPGEFSRRAFLHGKLDLAQTEAIHEAITAASPLALTQAGARLHGRLSACIQALHQDLLDLRARFLVALDFPEEDVPDLAPEEVRPRVQGILSHLDQLLAAARLGTLAREGAVVVLAGRVNAGKSSLMNALLGRERAIVSPLPGTTRDTLEETLHLDGIPVRLVDTAGLRPAQDPVEAEGIRRAQEALDLAHLVLLVLDATILPTAEDEALLAQGTPVIVAPNKMDLLPGLPPWTSLPPWSDYPCTPVSARTGAGLDSLCQAMAAALQIPAQEDSGLTPNERQARHLEAARQELHLLLQGIASLPPDLLAVHLDAAAAELAAITGASTTEDVLDAVFSRFCLGK